LKKPALYALKTLNLKLTLPSLAPGVHLSGVFVHGGFVFYYLESLIIFIPGIPGVLVPGVPGVLLPRVPGVLLPGISGVLHE
jgi:hypothetical protein